MLIGHRISGRVEQHPLGIAQVKPQIFGDAQSRIVILGHVEQWRRVAKRQSRCHRRAGCADQRCDAQAGWASAERSDNFGNIGELRQLDCQFM